MQPTERIKTKSDRRAKRKDSIVKYRCKCPICGGTWKSTTLRHKSDLKRINGTMDCPKCNSLLLLDGKIKPFHIEMNKRTNGKWPVDGTGCFSIGIENDDVYDESDKAREK